LRINEGQNYVDQHSGDAGQTYERWGDYSGTQRKYNEPGKIWATGYYGDEFKRNATWVAELQSVDSTIMSVSINDTTLFTDEGICHGLAEVTVINGNPPIIYSWNDPLQQSSATVSNLCEGNYTVMVTDAFLCTISSEVEITTPPKESKIFPNPTSNITTINFDLESDSDIEVSIYSRDGKLVRSLVQTEAKQGANLFSFSTTALSSGVYFVRIVSNNEIIAVEKILKL